MGPSMGAGMRRGPVSMLTTQDASSAGSALTVVSVMPRFSGMIRTVSTQSTRKKPRERGFFVFAGWGEHWVFAHDEEGAEIVAAEEIVGGDPGDAAVPAFDVGRHE